METRDFASRLDDARREIMVAIDSLQIALGAATRVESILLLQFISSAANLASDIQQLSVFHVADADDRA